MTEPSVAPIDIKATTTTHDTIAFEWDPPVCGFRHGAIISYTYKLSSSSGEITQGSTDDDNAVFTGLESSTEYVFQVAASTRAGMGPFSEELHVTTQGTVTNHVIPMWCACDIHVVCMYYPYGVHVIPIWRACDIHVVCMYYPCSVHVIPMWCTCGAQMSTDDGRAVFTGLESSTEYVFQVAASTRACMGPFSEVLHVKTRGIVNYHKDGVGTD